MTFDQINPLTGKVKEYKNSAEWIKDVEEATSKTPEKKPEVMTYADASKRLREEIGLDLRSPQERQQAENNNFIEQRIAAGVAEALEKAQQAEKASQSLPAKAVSHSSQKGLNDRLSDFASLTGWKITPCGCKKASQKAEAQPVIHSRRGTGPTMEAHSISYQEAQIRPSRTTSQEPISPVI